MPALAFALKANTVGCVSNDRTRPRSPAHLRLAREGILEAFYAPLHGVTADAEVVIVGLSPGLSQMLLAFRKPRPPAPRRCGAPRRLRRDPTEDGLPGTHVNRRNYWGSPKVEGSTLLSTMSRMNLPADRDLLPDAVVVPLGRAVEATLAHLQPQGAPGLPRSPRNTASCSRSWRACRPERGDAASA